MWQSKLPKSSHDARGGARQGLQACNQWELQSVGRVQQVEPGGVNYKWLEAGPACLPLLWASASGMPLTGRWERCRLAESGAAFDNVIKEQVHLTEHWESCRLAESGGAFDNVFVERGVASGGELLMRLARLRGLLADPPRRPVRLLVIDSVAHLFRDAGAPEPHGLNGGAYGPDGQGGGGAGAYGARAAALFRLAALLKRYADEFGLAVVVTNQARAAAAAIALSSGTGCSQVSGCHAPRQHLMELIPGGRSGPLCMQCMAASC